MTAPVIDFGTGSPLDRIVVPLAPGTTADRATALAHRLASSWDLPILLVAVAHGPGTAVDVETGTVLESARQAIAHAHPDLAVDDIVVGGGDDEPSAAAAVLGDGDLVIMATDAGGDDGGFSFAQELAIHWGGPVLMLGPAAADVTALDGDVVLALDGSALAERTFGIATGLARALDRPLHCVHVVSSDVVSHIEHLRERGERVSESSYLIDATARIDFHATWEVLHGDDPAQTLIDHVAQRAPAALVMGTHGLTGLIRSRFGSVTMDVVGGATRPVVVLCPQPIGATAQLT